MPDGFFFHYFTDIEDMKSWCEIETSVLEFSSESEAKEYFAKAYLPYEKELKNRCVFIADKNGLAIATATAWYADSELGHQASLHWVSVRPEYQRLGFGKAVVQKALQDFHVLEPNSAVWLHTQTWSHVAVRLYYKLGFRMVKQDRLANASTGSEMLKLYPNDFQEAIEVLKRVMDEAMVLELANTAR